MYERTSHVCKRAQTCGLLGMYHIQWIACLRDLKVIECFALAINLYLLSDIVAERGKAQISQKQTITLSNSVKK